MIPVRLLSQGFLAEALRQKTEKKRLKAQFTFSCLAIRLYRLNMFNVHKVRVLFVPLSHRLDKVGQERTTRPDNFSGVNPEIPRGEEFVPTKAKGNA